MKLENQVVNLELSKHIKQLGVKQDSLWYWHDEPVFVGGEIDQFLNRYKEGNCFSAFTVAELGEMLPESIQEDGYTYYLEIDKDGRGIWAVTYDSKYSSIRKWGTTEANARARMVVYLKENGKC